MNNGITSAFSHENQEWKSVAAAEFEISDYINKEKLTELIFGPLWGQFISSFFANIKFLLRNTFFNYIASKNVEG